MSIDKDPKVQGEGDYEAAKRYTDDKRKFVKEGKVEEAAEKAGKQSKAEGEAARREAAKRAKEHDPRETAKHE